SQSHLRPARSAHASPGGSRSASAYACAAWPRRCAAPADARSPSLRRSRVPAMPVISVVIPIHNVETYLRECLQSVARQTVGDLEVIMVDDGSTDRSATIAEEFTARDPRFRLIRQRNGGLGQARNTGADAATGDFLAFVDGDD